MAVARLLVVPFTDPGIVGGFLEFFELFLKRFEDIGVLGIAGEVDCFVAVFLNVVELEGRSVYVGADVHVTVEGVVAFSS